MRARILYNANCWMDSKILLIPNIFLPASLGRSRLTRELSCSSSWDQKVTLVDIFAKFMKPWRVWNSKMFCSKKCYIKYVTLVVSFVGPKGSHFLHRTFLSKILLIIYYRLFFGQFFGVRLSHLTPKHWVFFARSLSFLLNPWVFFQIPEFFHAYSIKVLILPNSVFSWKLKP